MLEVSSKYGAQGFIFIDKGEVRHAKCDEPGSEEALFRCLGFEGGSFVNLPWSEPDAITIRNLEFYYLWKLLERETKQNRAQTRCQTNSSGDYSSTYYQETDI